MVLFAYSDTLFILTLALGLRETLHTGIASAKMICIMSEAWYTNTVLSVYLDAIFGDGTLRDHH